MNRPVHVIGDAIWAPGFATADAFLSGAPDPDVVEPPIAFVHSRMQRAISLMCRMSVQVAHDATRDADIALENCATVFGSSHGEMQIAVDQMVMMQEGEGRLSPARFKNSVHNTAAGLFSIAAQNRGFTTAIAGGDHTFPLSLLEGFALVATGEAEHAVVCISDEDLPVPLDRCVGLRALAAAVVLSERPSGPRMSLPGLAAGEADDSHPAHAALRLIRARRAGAQGTVQLTGGDRGYAVELKP